MRARLKSFTLITAVLVAVTAGLVADAPAARRRRRRHHRSRRLLAVGAAVGLFLAMGAAANGLVTSDEPTAHASTPSMRLASAEDTTTTTSGPTTTSTSVVPPTTTTIAAPPAPDPNALIWPARGPIWSPFGPRPGERHTGDDIGAPAGSTIVAAQAGTVVYAGWESGYGQETRIDHGGGISTLYAHQARLFVHVGQRVAQGEVIGIVGSTGRVTAPHLHFEVRVNGVPQNPMRWLSRAAR
jgi:murein DD-endopeptidase MepM/ murein hydrolase activator NlpD